MLAAGPVNENLTFEGEVAEPEGLSVVGEVGDRAVGGLRVVFGWVSEEAPVVQSRGQLEGLL